MKKINILLALIIIATTAFTPIVDRSTEILGKWRVDDNSIKSFVTAQIESRRKTDPEAAEQMEQNMDMMETSVALLVFEYKSNNTVELTAPQGVQEVKWRLSDNNNTLIITRPNGTERKDSILELTASKFKVLQGERRDTIVYIRL